MTTIRPILSTLGLGLAAAGLLALPVCAQTSPQPRLLPFQGRLTDADGGAISDGARVVQFKLYDAPVAGRAVWGGEVHNLTVNRGLVNTMLGSLASLDGVDFDLPTYLEITVDANADARIDLADPPLLPRQSVLPAVFAKESANARKLDGYDWNDLFAEGPADPSTAKISGSRLVSGSVTSAQIESRSITTDRLALSAVTGLEIKDGSVDRRHLTSGVLESVIPPGVIIPFAGPADKIPAGWLPCDGRLAKSAEYPLLHAAIGASWGDGSVSGSGNPEDPPNAATDFNLPDLRGAFLRGLAGGSSRDPDAGDRMRAREGGNSGDAVGSLQADDLREHNHPVTVQRAANSQQVTNDGQLGVHSSGPPVGADFGSGFGAGDTFKGNGLGISRTSLGTSNTGGKETRPVNLAVLYLIKY